MSRWTVTTEREKRFCSRTGKPDYDFVRVRIHDDGEHVLSVFPKTSESIRCASEDERAAAAEKRGRWIAAVLNAASPYV